MHLACHELESVFESSYWYALNTPCRREVSLESLLFCLCHLLQARRRVLMHENGYEAVSKGMDM